MHSLAHDYPATLLAEREAPCLSLYQPTHRHHPDNEQDPVRFRNLVKRLAVSLRAKYPACDLQALLHPFEALAEDRNFWNKTGDGLAVLGATDFFRVYRLQRPVAELAIVADSFHAKPLMRIVQSADRYQILGLNRQAFKVFEGNRDVLDELSPIADVPQTAVELLGKTPDDREGAHRTHGPNGVAAVTQQGGGVPHAAATVTRHGTDVRQDIEDRDTEQFFRAVDAAVLKHCSQPSGQRLILAALPQHHHLFRAVSANPSLMDEAIDVHPDALSMDALRERAWQVVLPHYLQRLAGLVESFGAAASNGRGADDLHSIAEAAIAGRIETLLIEADRLLSGHIESSSGEITIADLAHPEIDDVFDDLGEIVLKKGGEVIVVPSDRMPTTSGAAAIYRY
ncbi:hypothetical protein SAMN05421690_10058 [Nitrosomonas sp. Nm51]|uniref:baeRF3 domain-containing protein n=1 Tax=Nitrosomonas sp. Nm51 TaxID=133720 RepID=UPI0008AAD334|nr:hypothetical protein [Nitrosomonas sp. Nm51]SEQ98408.1 hypothetical protein SAMN05421690_10058 [Nitrosomonas sp. Nm51]